MFQHHDERTHENSGQKNRYNHAERVSGILVLLATAACVIGYMLSLHPRHRPVAVIAFFVAWVLVGLAIAIPLWIEYKTPEGETPKEQRPRIWVKTMIAHWENFNAPPSATFVEVTLENSSSVPVFDVTAKAFLYKSDHKLTELPPLPEQSEVDVLPFMPAHGGTTHVIGSPTNPEPDLKNKIKSEKMFMYVFGWVTYKSQHTDTKKYTLSFCALYMPRSNNFEVTRFGNKTD